MLCGMSQEHDTGHATDHETGPETDHRTDPHPFPVSEPGLDPGSAPLLAELCRLLARHAPVDGVHDTVIPGVAAVRASHPGDGIGHALHQAALCLIAQGAKQVMLGEEVYVYDASRHLVFSVDLPIGAQVMRASPDEPYLCFRLDLPAQAVADTLLRVGTAAVRPLAPASLQAAESARGLFLSRTDAPLLDAVVRLLRLLDSPDDAAALAPLVQQEIIYRLLRGDEGARLARVAHADSQAHRVTRAINWLKTHYAEPLRIEALARQVHMSASSLHHHFRAVTAMSPLQYQKQLRLQEARRLLLGEVSDAASAGHRVGYESPSQFSREYARLFGVPPARDAQRLRQQVGGVAVV
jgi:AraC-like DNA-binding protein